MERRAALLALLALVAATIALDHETMLCANDNTPICGRSQGEYLLFKNECDLRKAQRENLMGAPLHDVALHYCVPSCDFECEQRSQPVCGVSVASGERRSFRNRCEMIRIACLGRSDWLLHKAGACPPGERQDKRAAHTLLIGQPKRRRPIPCTNVYRPVCASYAGVKSTFSNECLVNAENIRTRRNWRIIAEGLCGEDSTKMKHSRKWKPQTKTKTKSKVNAQRSKRSHKQLNQLDELEGAVQIFAPSTFHTQFISNSGTTMEKSYSLPARKPHVSVRARSSSRARRIYGNTMEAEVKPCVFSNEPVCGSFNGESRTFASVCALMEFSQTVGNAWTILHEGVCRRCDKPCPAAFSPLCANRNGISYTIINECYLERVRCKDPNSDWKILHKGECAQPAEEVAQSIPSPRSSRIPHMLYAGTATATTRPRTNFRRTSAPRAAATTSAPASRRQLKRLRRPTNSLKPKPTLKDLSNRKIRKIEPSYFDTSAYDLEPQPIRAPVTSKLWSSWQAPHSLENGHEKDLFAKRPHFKKAHSEKYPHYHWQQPMLATTAEATTMRATLAPLNTLEGIAEGELLNVDMKAAGEIFGEIEADTEIFFMLATTPAATKATEAEEATTRATTTQTTTAKPTETSTKASPASTTTTPTTSASTTTTTTTAARTTPFSSEDTTELPSESDTDESTTNINFSTLSDEGTSEVELDATAAATTTTRTTTTTDLGDKSTTLSLDYMSEDALLAKSDQTSIYGLDKNSLIMRLLRARSSKNMVL